MRRGACTTARSTAAVEVRQRKSSTVILPAHRRTRRPSHFTGFLRERASFKSELVWEHDLLKNNAKSRNHGQAGMGELLSFNVVLLAKRILQAKWIIADVSCDQPMFEHFLLSVHFKP